MEDKDLNFNAEEENELSLADILKLCWDFFKANWKWYALSVVVCLVLGEVYKRRSTLIYKSQAVVLIENAEPTDMASFGSRAGGSMNALLELNGISAGNNLTNEMFVLNSHRLMQNVIDTLGLNVDYAVSSSLHKVSLYKATPFVANLGVAVPENVSFEVKILDDANYELSELSVLYDGAREFSDIEGVWAGKFNEVLATPVGDICLNKQETIANFLPKEDDEKADFEPVSVYVTRISRYAAIEKFRASVSIAEYDKKSSLVVLSCSDNNVARANDILTEIYQAYKRDVVGYKNRIAQSTADFIDRRIQLIASDLSNVEGRYERFMEENKLVNIEGDASRFLQETSMARQATLDLETQLSVAKYLTDYMKEHAKNDQTIPVLSGLGTDGSIISSQINEYNKLVLERMRQAENASVNSPIVKDLDRRMEALRPTIMAGLSSYVRAVEMHLEDAKKNERTVTKKVSNLPSKQREALDIKRQQELKNALYTFLLNKREEVALQLAINEANVRMVEYPMCTGAPISPRTNMIVLMSLVLGVLIPTAILYVLQLFDTKLKNRMEVEKLTSTPIVAELPTGWATRNRKPLPTSSPIVLLLRPSVFCAIALTL